MSYAQQFSDQTQSYNASLDSYWQSAVANHQTRVANASRVGEELMAFANLANEVGGKLAKRKEYLIEQSKLKLYNEGLSAFAEGTVVGPTGDSPEEIEEYTRNIDLAFQARQQGKPVEFGHKLLNIGEHDRRHFQQGLMAGMASQQNTIMQQIIKDERLPTGTERELAGSMATAFTKYLQRNVMPFDERVVLSAMPTLHQNFTKLKQQYTSANNIRNSEFTLQRTKAEFGLGLVDYSQSLRLLQGVVNPKNGKNYTSADANKIMVDHLKNLAKQGALSRAVEDNYFSSKPSWGGGKTLQQLKPDLYNEIQSLKIDYQSNRADTASKRAARAAAADAEEIKERYYARVAAGDRPSDAWQALELEQWRQKHIGQDEGWLASLITQEEFTQIQKFENAEGIAERDGYIIDTHPDLKGLTADQRNTLSPFIKSETEVQEITKEKGFAEQRIDAVLKAIPESYGAKEKEWTDRGIVLKQNALRRLDDLIATKVGQGETYRDAIQNSAQEIVDSLVTVDDKGRRVPNPEFDTYKNNRVNTSAFRQEVSRIGRAMLDTPLDALTPGQYQVPQDVALYLDRQAKGLERPDKDHPLIEKLAELNPSMSKLDVKRWMHKNLSAPFIPNPKDEGFDVIQKMSYVPGLTVPNSPFSALRNILGLNAVNPDLPPVSRVDFNHAFTVHPALRKSAIDPIRHAIGLNEGTVDSLGRPTEARSGHRDTGDNQVNIGMYSASSGRQLADFSTPDEADAYHDNQLDGVRENYQSVLARYGIPMTTTDYSLFLGNIEDLHIQAPAAVSDFAKSLREVIDLRLTGDDLIAEVAYRRARAYINPETNRLETTFKPTEKLTAFQRLFQDQWARAGTVIYGERRSYSEDQILEHFRNNPLTRIDPANAI